jgi:hypothetical protein
MTIYSASGKTLATAANSNLLSIRSTATKLAKLLELHIFSEAATAFVAPALFLTTVVDTAGTAVTLQAEDGKSGAATTVVSTIPTGGTLAAVAIRRASLPAAVGSGIMWQFRESGLVIPPSLSLMFRNDGVIGPAITWVAVVDE